MSNECESGSPHEYISSVPKFKANQKKKKKRENGRNEASSEPVSLFLAIELVKHVVVTLDALLASMVEMIWVAEHLVDLHATPSILG